MLTIRSFAASLLGSAVLAACGSSTIERPSGAYGIWRQQEADEVAQSFLPSIAQLLARPDDEGVQRLLTPSIGGIREDSDHEGSPSFDLGCGKIVEGHATDSDSDGVPARLLVEYGCTDAGGYHYAGHADVYDEDDENVFGGYGFLFNGYSVTREGIGFTVDGTAKLKTRAGGGFDFASELTFTQVAPSSRKAWGVFIESGWQPTDVTRPEVAGVLDRVSGYLVLRKDGDAVAIEVSGIDLHYASSCASRPQSGEIHLRGYNGVDLVQSYESCEVRATTFAGATL